MHRLKLGLEIHAQLAAPHKLFSVARHGAAGAPNTRVACFDAALPGTLPRLNWDCVYLAIAAARALDARVNSRFAFDRKHYMYPDQPAGYQLTQRLAPVATGGALRLLARDGVKTPKRITLAQIQLEQDTGRSSHIDGVTLVDLNRANTGLIELVTNPDFGSADEAVAFVRKLRLLLRTLRVCTGEMEQGALRVDVNVNVVGSRGEPLSERCEIKNLFGFGAIRHAVAAEFRRHCALLSAGEPVPAETRGWDGKNTYKLRRKEAVADYRYFPDPELPEYVLPASVIDKVVAAMPTLPDAVLDMLVASPYALSEADAYKLVETPQGPETLAAIVREFRARGGSEQRAALAGRWLVNIWMGHSVVLPPIQQFADVLLAVDAQTITTTTAKLLLQHLANGYKGSVDALVREFGLQTAAEPSELQVACAAAIRNHADVVLRIKRGKTKAITVLIGAVIKETQGTHDPAAVRAEIERQLTTEPLGVQ